MFLKECVTLFVKSLAAVGTREITYHLFQRGDCLASLRVQFFKPTFKFGIGNNTVRKFLLDLVECSFILLEHRNT